MEDALSHSIVLKKIKPRLKSEAHQFFSVLGDKLHMVKILSITMFISFISISSESHSDSFLLDNRAPLYLASITEKESKPVITGPSYDSDGAYTLSWTKIDGATIYTLQEKYNQGRWSSIYNGVSTRKSVNGRQSGDWHYQVTACDETGCTRDSDIFSVFVTTQ